MALTERHGRSARLEAHLPVAAPHLEVALAHHARTDGVLEALTEILRHEGVDDGVDARVEVGHEGERLADVFQVVVVVLLDQTKGDEDVVDEAGSPAEGKERDHCHQHLDHLQGKGVHTRDLVQVTVVTKDKVTTI